MFTLEELVNVEYCCLFVILLKNPYIISLLNMLKSTEGNKSDSLQKLNEWF